MAQEWVQLRCPKCDRLHEVPEGTISYICGKCRSEVTLDLPEPDEPEDENWGYYEGE